VVLDIFMRAIMSRALLAAAVVAVLIGILSTPDFNQIIITAISSFILIVGVLFICLWIFRVANWSLAKQRVFICLVAIGMGVFIVFFPYGIKFLTR
jgi:hypothetical protein